MIPKSNTFVPPVLPTVLSLQCKALRCITLEYDGGIVGSFLREDSAISCLSPSYKRFQAVVILGLLVYSSIPLMWFVILWRVRRELNPLDETLESALELRKSHDQLGYLAFLFSDCEYVVILRVPCSLSSLTWKNPPTHTTHHHRPSVHVGLRSLRDDEASLFGGHSALAWRGRYACVHRHLGVHGRGILGARILALRQIDQ